MRLFKTAIVSLYLLIVVSCKQKTSDVNYYNLPKLSSDLKIDYTNSNPLLEALKPVPETAVFEMKGYSLWDPSVIQVDDTFHLFCSRWKEADGWDAWKKSHVIRATSKSLFGPYKFEEVVIKPEDHPWATAGIHNPKIIKIGNKFLLYHLGIPKWHTGFLFSDSIEGPWEALSESLIKTNNPSIWVHEDGRVYALGKFKPAKKDTKDGRWDAYMRAFKAPNIMGPYDVVGDNKNRLPNDFELEDPTVWYSNNQYNVICTDWEAKVTGIDKSVLLYTSKNGIDYSLYSQIPLWHRNEPTPMEGGKILLLDKIERPQVYLNKQNELVALLVSATRKSNSDQGIIIVRPVEKFTP